MGPRKPQYPIEELLMIRETTRDTNEAVRRISNSEIGGLLHFTPLLFPQPNDSSASICLPEALIQDLSDRRMYPSPSPCSEAPASSPFQRNYNALPSADSPALFESEYSPCEEVAMLTLCAKENLLKSTSGFRHQKPRSSSTATNPYEENLANEGSYRGGKSRSRSGKQSKWSPTASMRRAKAEHLLKAHGSPPGIRVTAGGRIVPDGLSPLASPRYDFTFKSGPAFARPFTYGAPSFSSPHHPANGTLVPIGNGMLGQFIDGEVHPIFMPPPALSMQPGMAPFGSAPSPMFHPQLGPQHAMHSVGAGFEQPPSYIPAALPTVREIRVMEQFHSKLEQELKDLNRNEVLNRASLNSRKREEIVKQRIELTQRIDDSRIAIAAAKKVVESATDILQQPVHGTDMFTASETNGHSATLNYNAYQERFQPSNTGLNDLNSTKHFNLASGAVFHPDITEFVPRQFSAATANLHHSPTAALQERAVNANMGSVAESVGEYGSSTDTAKRLGSGGINLDGSVHHPRRSHAVMIRDPRERPSKEHPSLNPTSPSYKPTTAATTPINGDERGEMLDFMPSLSNVTHHHDLAKSTPQPQQEHDSSHTTHQHSDSSVNTADFFPADAHEHSSTQFRMNMRHANQPSWMPKQDETDSNANKCQTTPARLPSKFMFNDDSPGDRYYMNPPGATESATVSPSYGIARSPAGLAFDSKPPVTDVKSDTYWAGYRTGIKMDIMPDGTDERFRIGYRDGLVQSSIKSPKSSESNPHAPPQSGPSTLTLGDQSHLLTKATSFPSLNPFSIPVTPVLEAPANSLATTPTGMRSAARNNSESLEDALDLTSTLPTASEYISRSKAAYPSQLTNLHIDNTPSDLSYVAAMLKEPRHSFENQHYRKSTVSTVQSNQQALAIFPQQYDGSTEEDEPIAGDVPLSTPASPATATGRMDDKTKAAGSPVRRKASAAVATMRQVTGIGGKRITQSGGKKEMSSPEKKQWREKWSKIRQPKHDEIKGSSDTPKKHPIH